MFLLYHLYILKAPENRKTAYIEETKDRSLYTDGNGCVFIVQNYSAYVYKFRWNYIKILPIRLLKKKEGTKETAFR
jgi:hypothetical protein